MAYCPVQQSYRQRGGEYMTAVKTGIDISQPSPKTAEACGLIQQVIQLFNITDQDLAVLNFDQFLGFEIAECTDK